MSARDIDLFGAEVVPEKFVKSVVNGYAAQPGFGPLGETCRSCANATLHDTYSKRYWKCGLVRPTNGPGTDIRLKSPACRRWEKKP